jgi:sugar phosphate isomerase/epimerase
MKLCFSTLGCPNWTIQEVLRAAQKYGYGGVELRGAGRQHISPEFTPLERRDVRQRFEDAGLEIVCLTAYTRFAQTEASALAEQVETLKQYIDLAAEIGAPLVRTFGGEYPEAVDRERLFEGMATGLREAGDYAAQAGVKIVLETHDAFCLGAVTGDVLKRTNHPAVGVLWDVWHTFRFGETLPEAYNHLQGYIFHVHLKDGQLRPERGPGEHNLCLPGEGDLPIKAVLSLLMDQGYQDWFCLEWEKTWHPELPETEVALAHFAELMQGYWTEIVDGSQ